MFSFPLVNNDNNYQKLESVENILNEHGIDISFNVYTLADDKVHTKIITKDNTLSVSRITSSSLFHIRVIQIDYETIENRYNLMLSNEKNKQFHCGGGVKYLSVYLLK